MRKKIIFPMFFLMVITLGMYMWLNRINYDIYEKRSNTEANPKDGIHFTIEANKKNGSLHIENNSDRYIVIDFGRKPIHIEIQQGDGWHRILSHKSVNGEPCAIPEGTTYSLDFTWRNFVNGPLKPGNYRAVLYFGDGISEIYTYSVMAEFCID